MTQVSFRDRTDSIASADEMGDTRLIEGAADEYDDPSEMPGSAIDALRITDDICEVNLLLVNAGAPPMNEAELRLHALAFAAGVGPERFARTVMHDRRRLNGPDGVAA